MAANSSISKSSGVTQTHDQCSQSGLYPGEECSKKGTSKCFSTQQKLSKHLKQCHRPRSFICDICLKSFGQNSMLTRHKKTVHSAAHKFTCTICLKVYTIRSSLQEHMFTAHKLKTGNWSYSKCDMCSKEFALKSRLETHVIKKHVVDKEFQCSVCSKKFIDLQSLDKHKGELHPSVTTYFTCDVCSGNFKFKSYLLKHVKILHPNHTHCLKCGRSFLNKLTFDQHLETNSKNSEAFKCQICHVMCTSQCSFDWHTNSHIQKLKSQATQSESQGESKGDAQYNCELCLESFETESNLFKHRKNIHFIHTREFKCIFENCLETFGSASTLRRHKLNHHKMECSPYKSRQKSMAPSKLLQTQE